MPITTNVVSSKPPSGEVYSIQHYVIKFVSDLRLVDGFLRVIRLTQPIQLLKVALNTIYLNQRNEEREIFVLTAFFEYHLYLTVYQTVVLSCFKLHLIRVIYILFRHKYFLYFYYLCIFQVRDHKFLFIFFVVISLRSRLLFPTQN